MTPTGDAFWTVVTGAGDEILAFLVVDGSRTTLHARPPHRGTGDVPDLPVAAARTLLTTSELFQNSDTMRCVPEIALFTGLMRVESANICRPAIETGNRTIPLDDGTGATFGTLDVTTSAVELEISVAVHELGTTSPAEISRAVLPIRDAGKILAAAGTPTIGE